MMRPSSRAEAVNRETGNCKTSGSEAWSEMLTLMKYDHEKVGTYQGVKQPVPYLNLD